MRDTCVVLVTSNTCLVSLMGANYRFYSISWPGCVVDFGNDFVSVLCLGGWSLSFSPLRGPSEVMCSFCFI